MDFDAGPVFNAATFKDIIYPLAVVVMGAVTAGVSWRTFYRSRKADRERRIRELNVLATKVIQGWLNLEGFGKQLKETNLTEFVAIISQGVASAPELDSLGKSKEIVECYCNRYKPYLEHAKCLQKKDTKSLSNDEITDLLSQFDAYLVTIEMTTRHLESIREFEQTRVSLLLQMSR